MSIGKRFHSFYAFELMIYFLAEESFLDMHSDVLLNLTPGVWIVQSTQCFHCRMPLTIYSKEQIRSRSHIQRSLELFPWKVMLSNNTETHRKSSNWNTFWCIPNILWESNYLIMPIFKIRFLFYFWNFMLFSDIKAW